MLDFVFALILQMTPTQREIERARLHAIEQKMEANNQRQTAALRARVQAEAVYDNCVRRHALEISQAAPNESAGLIADAATDYCNKESIDLYLKTDDQVKIFGDDNTDELMEKWRSSASNAASRCVLEWRTNPDQIGISVCKIE